MVLAQLLTDHGTGALSGTDATTTYTPTAAGTGPPHAVQEATIKGGAKDGQKSTFTYDAAGNTRKRTTGASTQDLTWDDEGHLATLTESGKTTSYLYDADGSRMITRDADGSQTLTLPGDNELKVTKDGVKQGVRYYTHEDETVAVRTSSGFSFLLPDHQGTALTAVSMTTLAITRRKQLPFGSLRSETNTALPGTRGFVGGTSDLTGLIHLGAREYDSALGRFISVDPLIDLDDPQQMNAYAYANNRPITASDPDGQMIYDDFTGQGYGNAKVMKNYYKANGYIDSKGRTTKKYKKRLTAYNKSWSNYYASSYYKNQLKEAAQANARIAARLKAQAEARRKAQEAERRKKGILASIKSGIGNGLSEMGSNLWDNMNPEAKMSLYFFYKGAEYMWDHGYVSGSACLMVCLNLGFQRGVTTVGITGGLTFGGTKGIVRGNMGNYAGVSAGINTAKPDEQAFQVASVTSANGFRGGTFAWGKRTTGGNYYQYGWAGGKGTALQGPMLIGLTYSRGNGVTWYPYSN
ncbi:RHS repeat-associated core domain-containing protein [Streptomyces sp. A2-16]|uniref:RHS repeat domain-containing protein n=1 Tax=Streptomyces sp. A2-16 TaxID=2781734 RepID=UPI002012D1B5|nr:RHS repeat-associated core domain-containing protein [Streptomyces sp. A2-16]